LSQTAINAENKQEGESHSPERQSPWYRKKEVVAPFALGAFIALVFWLSPHTGENLGDRIAKSVSWWITTRTPVDWLLALGIVILFGLVIVIRRQRAFSAAQVHSQELAIQNADLQTQLTTTTLAKDQAVSEVDRLKNQHADLQSLLTTTTLAKDKALTEVDRFKNQQDDLQTLLATTTLAKDQALTEVDRLRTQLKDFIPYKKNGIGRWENLVEVKYGHIPYMPFLMRGGYNGKQVIGLGAEFLTELLDHKYEGVAVKVEADDDDTRNWKNIVEGLGIRYEVIATPMFATFERSKEVRFTAPLFYSNIGLYVSAKLPKLALWNKIGMDNFRPGIREHFPTLKFLSVKGEISQHLAKNYASDQSIEDSEDVVNPNKLFKKIAEGSAPHYAIFSESFTAELDPLFTSGEVINVLPYHRILYPVCYAVRLGDHQLANLLNIRLLQLTRKQSALDRLVYKLLNEPSTKNLYTEQYIRKHFVNEWPTEPLRKTG